MSSAPGDDMSCNQELDSRSVPGRELSTTCCIFCTSMVPEMTIPTSHRAPMKEMA